MTRVLTEKSSAITDPQEDKNLLISSYTGEKNNLVTVITNSGNKPVNVKLKVENGGRKYQKMSSYLTTAENDLKRQPVQRPSSAIIVPARSITTVILE